MFLNKAMLDLRDLDYIQCLIKLHVYFLSKYKVTLELWTDSCGLRQGTICVHISWKLKQVLKKI